MTDELLDFIFYHGAHPLWSYLQAVLDIDITSVCARVAKDEPLLKTSEGEIAARVVTLPYARTLGPASNNDITFLLNSITTVFKSLRGGLEQDGEKILQAYDFALDDQSNLMLVDAETRQPVCDQGIAVMRV